MFHDQKNISKFINNRRKKYNVEHETGTVHANELAPIGSRLDPA